MAVVLVGHFFPFRFGRFGGGGALPVARAALTASSKGMPLREIGESRVVVPCGIGLFTLYPDLRLGKSVIVAKSKFEQGLELLEQAIPLLRQAFAEQETTIRQGIIATIAGNGQAALPPLQVKPHKAGVGKAPRGAAREFVKKLLANSPKGNGLGRH